jgi:integrase
MTKRSGSAVPRKDAAGRWYFVVDGGRDPETGKRRQVYRRGFRTQKDAQEALDKIRGQRRTSAYVRPTKDTVAEYMTKWLAGLHKAGRRPSTIDGYRRCLDYVISTKLGSKKLDALTAHDLDELYAQLLVDGKRRKPHGGLSFRSVRYIHVVVHKALSDAVKKGTLMRNVAALADPPSAKSAKPAEMSWWKPDELRTFLSVTADEAYGPLFHLAAMTGMRRGEVCGLRWSDVDLPAARIEVRNQLLVVRSPGAADGGLLFSPVTKTDHGRRSIDLDPGTVAVLKVQRKRQAEHKLALGAGWSNEHDLVFTQPDGSWVDPESVAKVFGRRVERAELPRIRFHDLRHSHVAHLIESGEVPLLQISKRLGHASVSFTMDRYGHLAADSGSKAASAVAALVFGTAIGER